MNPLILIAASTLWWLQPGSSYDPNRVQEQQQFERLHDDLNKRNDTVRELDNDKPAPQLFPSSPNPSGTEGRARRLHKLQRL